MHPTEGSPDDSSPPRPRLSRRSCLALAAGAGLLAGGLGALVDRGGNATGSGAHLGALTQDLAQVGILHEVDHGRMTAGQEDADEQSRLGKNDCSEAEESGPLHELGKIGKPMKQVRD